MRTRKPTRKTDFMKKTRTASPETITVTQLAILANLTPRRIRQLGDEGKIPKAENARLPMVESIKLLFQYYQRDSATLEREKTLKTCAERKLRERELATLENKLIEARVAQLAVTGAVMAHHAIVKRQMDHNFARLVLGRLEGLDESARQKIHDAVAEVARGIVTGIESDCQKYGRDEAPA
jgi:hypothetical protein